MQADRRVVILNLMLAQPREIDRFDDSFVGVEEIEDMGVVEFDLKFRFIDVRLRLPLALCIPPPR